jgi:hypothetical protein
VRCVQVADDRGVVRLPALDGLTGAGAQVNDDALIGDVNDPPVGAGERPAVEVFEG